MEIKRPPQRAVLLWMGLLYRTFNKLVFRNVGAFRPRFQRSPTDRADRVTRMRCQELLFSASVLGAAIASNNCRHLGNMRLGPSIFHPEPPKSTTPIAQEAQPAAHCRARETAKKGRSTSACPPPSAPVRCHPPRVKIKSISDSKSLQSIRLTLSRHTSHQKRPVQA